MVRDDTGWVHVMYADARKAYTNSTHDVALYAVLCSKRVAVHFVLASLF